MCIWRRRVVFYNYYCLLYQSHKAQGLCRNLESCWGVAKQSATCPRGTPTPTSLAFSLYKTPFAPKEKKKKEKEKKRQEERKP